MEFGRGVVFATILSVPLWALIGFGLYQLL
jgi:hypothetical protein